MTDNGKSRRKQIKVALEFSKHIPPAPVLKISSKNLSFVSMQSIILEMRRIMQENEGT